MRLSPATAAFAAAAAAVATGSPPPPPSGPCAGMPSHGCSVPLWGVSWAMADSLYTYCFGKCPLQSLANQTHLGSFGGVVGVDHYFTKQGMPCVDGEPTEFANQDAFANKWKATFPKARILEYRITDAVFYDPLVYNKMVDDPDAFVKFKNGTVCQTGPKAQTGVGPEYGNCKWSVTSSAYDWTNSSVRSWYLENIIKPTMKVGDGAWIDGDGPDNGAYECSGTYKPQDQKPPYPALGPAAADAFQQCERVVKAAAQTWLIANKGFEYNCIHFAGQTSEPTVTDSPDARANKLIELATKTQDAGITAMYGSRTGGNSYNDTTAAASVAAFMLVRQEHWLFVVTSVSDVIAPSTAALLLSDFGAPLGNMTNTSEYIFTRKYEKKTVTLDCSTFTASFV